VSVTDDFETLERD